MKGDFSRDTFSPRKHYNAVLMQQGRVQVDADWNEQHAIDRHRIEKEARDLIGPAGGRAGDAGFEIRVHNGETLSIGSGDLYIDGILCQNEEPVLLEEQPDLPGTRAIDLFEGDPEVGLVFLDVWEQHVTGLEDEGIREVALGGPDTATRSRTVWQVKVLPVEADTSDIAALQPLLEEHVEIVARLVPAPTNAVVPPPADAVAHWGFDEGSGGTAFDSSGNGNDGTLVGPTRSTGTVGALIFDGIDDYVQVGPALVMSSAVSIAAWIHPMGPGSDIGGIIVNKEGEYQVARFPDGSIRWAFANIDPGWSFIDTGHVAPTNRWTHVAVVYDNGIVKTYANGQLVHTHAGSGAIGDVSESLSDFRIGGRQGEAQHFQGLIDDVEIFDRALDAGEVVSLAAYSDELRSALSGTNNTILDLLGVDCDSTFEDEISDENPPSTGRLLARALPPAGDESPCLVAPGAGYERLENQLYRVEIHDRGERGDATFKWSRDNGSVATAVLGVTPNGTGAEIAVRDLGRDETLGFANGQIVELLDDGTELIGRASPLMPIVVDTATRTIAVDRTLPEIDPDSARTLHYKLRRWDSPGAVPIPAEEGAFVELEGGIQVQFTEGRYNTGDYWLIPARTATGQIEWPDNQPQPPAGGRHHYARLALVIAATVAGERKLLVLGDCRRLYPSVTELTSLFNLGGDGQEAGSGQPLPRPLVVGVANGDKPVIGARVRFEVQTEDPESYDGHLEADGDAGASVTATTDTRGEARCAWTLATGQSSQQVRASLVDGTHLRVYFNANLSAPGEAFAESIQITGVRLDGQDLRLESSVPAHTLAGGIQVVCTEDSIIDEQTVEKGATCFVTLELPYPQNAADRQLWGEALIGFQPLILAADVGLNEAGNRIQWRPVAATRDWLQNKLFQRIGGVERILARLTLKGNFIWDRQRPQAYLDGDIFGVRGEGGTDIGLGLPSGDGRHGGDFEMWFSLVAQPLVLDSVTLEQNEVLGGIETMRGTVRIIGTAPVNGVSIDLASSNAVVSVPDSVKIEAEQSSVEFPVDVQAVGSPTLVTITATLTTTGGSQQRTANLMVQPPALKTVAVQSEVIGKSVTIPGTIILTGPAPAGGGSAPPSGEESLSAAAPVDDGPVTTGGLNVALSSANPAIVKVPPSVNVPAGETAAQFPINTEVVSSPTPVAITGSTRDVQRTATLTVRPAIVNQLAITPNPILGGNTVTGFLTTFGPAHADFTVALESTDTNRATVQASVTVPQGSTSVSFPVNTKAVATTSDVTIKATRAGVQKSASLSVRSPEISSFAFIPSTINPVGSPTSSTGRITLNGPAPFGTTIRLTTNTDATANFSPTFSIASPANVPVPANATVIEFTATGKFFFGSGRSVTVTAQYLGTTRAATLTVLASGPA